MKSTASSMSRSWSAPVARGRRRSLRRRTSSATICRTCRACSLASCRGARLPSAGGTAASGPRSRRRRPRRAETVERGSRLYHRRTARSVMAVGAVERRAAAGPALSPTCNARDAGRHRAIGGTRARKGMSELRRSAQRRRHRGDPRVRRRSGQRGRAVSASLSPLDVRGYGKPNT